MIRPLNHRKVLKAETDNYKTEVKIADYRSGPRGGPIGFFSDWTVRSGPKKIRVRKFLGKKIRTKSDPIGPGKSLVLLIPTKDIVGKHNAWSTKCQIYVKSIRLCTMFGL